MKKHCIFITGSSGVGKSTLLQAVLAANWPNIKVAIPIKQTTRAIRNSLEHIELKHISPEQFESNFSAQQYIIHYENYGQSYGLLAQDFQTEHVEAEVSQLLYVQALPTFVAARVRQTLAKSGWSVAICLLRASEKVVLERLKARTDSEPSKRIVQRARHAKFDLSASADYVINSECEKEEVFTQFYSWVTGTLVS